MHRLSPLARTFPRLLPLVATAALLFAPSAHAFDCGDDPQNQLSTLNCDFDSDTAGWGLLSGSVINWLPANGEPELGALEAVDNVLAPNPAFQTAVRSPCAAVNGGANYGYGGRILSLAGGTLSCTVRLTWFAQAGCGSTIGTRLSPDTTVGTTNFAQLQQSFAMPASAVSAHLEFACSGGDTEPISSALDNAYLGEGLTLPVELQSFSIE